MAKFLQEDARKATFKKWPYGNGTPCNGDKMAEAGFIFTGSSEEPDSAQCFYCGKHLDGWEEDDDPWREHLKHAPNCDFAKLQKTQEELTLKDWLNFVLQFHEKSIRDKYEKQKKEVKQQNEKTQHIIAKMVNL